MRTMILTGALAVFTLGACVAEWQAFEGAYSAEWTYSDLVCDNSGCFFCDDFVCEEYRCDYLDQCPSGYVCTYDQRCLPGDGSIWNDGSQCITHRDCNKGELCTLDGNCVDAESPKGPDKPEKPADKPEPSVEEPETPTETTPTEETPTAAPIPLPEHPEGVCVVNNDCGSDGICLDAGCYFKCAADATCPGTQVCEEGQCMPSMSGEVMCTFNGECGPGLLCIEGACHATCSETASCGSHETCEGGLCAADLSPVIQCSGADSCEAGKGCVNGKCLATCGAENSCADGFSCEYGYCHQDVFCFTSEDCEGSLVCLDGACR